MSAKKLRDVRSSRFSVRLMKMHDLADEPVVPVRIERPSTASARRRIALRLDDDGADLRLVEAKPQERVVELAERAERPEPVARGDESRRACPAAPPSGAFTVSVATRCVAIERERHGRIRDASSDTLRLERPERDARARSPAGPTAPRAPARASRPPP